MTVIPLTKPNPMTITPDALYAAMTEEDVVEYQKRYGFTISSAQKLLRMFQLDDTLHRQTSIRREKAKARLSIIIQQLMGE